MPARGLAPQLDQWMPPGAFDQFDDVVDERLADVYAVDGFHRLYEIFNACHGAAGDGVELRTGHGSAIFAANAQLGAAAQDLTLVVRPRIAQAMAEHEAIELRLGQLEGAPLLDRVLRGDHQKRRRQRVRLVANRDFALLHGLEQLRFAPWGRRG